MTQAALAAGITRQAVSRWCKDAGIRIKEAEARYVLEVQLSFQRWMAKEPQRGASRITLSQYAEKVKRDLDAQQWENSSRGGK